MKNKKLKLARLERDTLRRRPDELSGGQQKQLCIAGLIESGNYNPTLKLCVAICQALGKTLNDLFWEETT